MALDPRPCLVCGRPQDDRLHNPDQARVHDGVGLRVEPHDYDPGERRQSVRRMDDRVKLVEDSMRRVGGGRRTSDE